MKPPRLFQLSLLLVSIAACTTWAAGQRRLYVASPGIRNYLEYGGHGILVFDIDTGHRFLRRISFGNHGLDPDGKVLNVKGICASAATGRVYVSTLRHLIGVDLRTDSVVWQRKFEFGCDRMSISPDGTTIYLPSLENDMWYVVDAKSGEEQKRLMLKSAAHNTVYGLDGSQVYLAGLKSPYLSVVDTSSHTVSRAVGPFSNSIRPFTVNGKQTLCFVTVNNLLGFEVGNVLTGEKLCSVEVQGFSKGTVKRHGCPSHGVGLTPDEREVWVTDAANERLHVFDATVMPPKQVRDIKLREQPGWITFSIDGSFAYPSTGEVIDTKTYQIVAALADDEGRQVHSEKMLEIDFDGDDAVHNGDQFGLGRVVND